MCFYNSPVLEKGLFWDDPIVHKKSTRRKLITLFKIFYTLIIIIIVIQQNLFTIIL